MNWTSRFQRLMSQFHIAFGPYKPCKRPEFPADEKLALRQAMQRDLIGDRPIKPLIESQPDTIKRGNETVPVDFEAMPNG
jgi:hypothetical protein